MFITAFLLLFLMSVLKPVSIYSESFETRPHGDKNKLLKGCASCHKGHGKYNTLMLSETKDTFCFRCHGRGIDVDKTKDERALARDAKVPNVKPGFEKPYHHPIEKTGIHKIGETLPEMDPSIPRHAECGDCHHHHFVTDKNKMSGIQGTDRHGARASSVKFEYELCFNCHSFSANLPADQTNKAELFNISNPSFHPVIAPGRNSEVPSLMPPLSPSSVIKCIDCHNNDDPQGPKGPHGSIYRHILAKNFTVSDGPEGSFQYELCYSCHRRDSILNNESFLYHELHISNAGISCRTCHNPHGSTYNDHLLDFDNISIRPSSTGRLGFFDFGNRSGQCFLNCHNKDHDPAVYPAGASP